MGRTEAFGARRARERPRGWGYVGAGPSGRGRGGEGRGVGGVGGGNRTEPCRGCDEPAPPTHTRSERSQSFRVP